MLKKYSFLVLIILLTNYLTADEINILKVFCTPEYDTIHDFSLTLDNNRNVFNLVRKSQKSKSQFDNQQLTSGDVVIASLKGKNVIVLSCPNFNPTLGGFFIVKYLHNGLTNSYKAFPMVLEKQGDNWELYTPPPRKQRIYALKVIPRTLAGVAIGVKYIQVVHN